MKVEWDCEFVQSGEAALAILDQKPFDVIVSDIQMPGMSGMKLLQLVSEKTPWIIRIALSGQADQKLSHQAVGTVHQFLWKPCSAKTLKDSLIRASSLSDLLGNQQLQGVIAKLKFLPGLPSLYLEIMEELRSETASAVNVGRIISRDISMTAKVLQLVNSAYYGPRQLVSNPAQATVLLGLETIQNLVLSLSVSSQFNQRQIERLGINWLWDHALRVGSFAKLVARNQSASRKAADYAFIAGILHDVGKLVLADNFAMKYYSALGLMAREKIELHDAEKEIFGADHTQVGAYLLGLWGLPEPVVMAVAFHHNPVASPENEFAPLTAVHIANVFEHETHPNRSPGALPQVDVEYLDRAKLVERFPVWQSVCLEENLEG